MIEPTLEFKTEKRNTFHTTFFWPKLAGFVIVLEILNRHNMIADWRVWVCFFLYRILCVVRDAKS